MVTIAAANATITLKDADNNSITPSPASSDFDLKVGSINDILVWRIGTTYYAVNGVVVEGT